MSGVYFCFGGTLRTAMQSSIYFAAVAGILLGGQVAAAEKQRTIEVTGEGKAAARPDIAVIRTGVVTVAEEPGRAMEANARAMSGVLDGLKKLGIASSDIQTSNLSLQPQYRYLRDPSGQNTRRLTGYRASNGVRVRLRDLSAIGRTVAALVEAGSNQISGISLAINNPKAMLGIARRNAVIDARERAELYAREMGGRAGKVLSLREQSVAVPRPRSVARAMAAERMEAVPVELGENEVRVSIAATFALEDVK